MLGTYIAANYVDSDWSLSFIYPGLIMGIVGFIIFMFLIDSPELMGMQNEVSGEATAHRRVDTGSDESDGDDLVGDEHPNNPEQVSIIFY